MKKWPALLLALVCLTGGVLSGQPALIATGSSILTTTVGAPQGGE